MPYTVPPKPDDERVRRNKRPFDSITLEWDGEVRGVPLGTGYPWCDATKKWWHDLRRSPNVMVCTDTDWMHLRDTALIYDRMWRDPLNLPPAQLATLASEFRRRMAPYGYSFDDRRMRRVDIKSPQSEKDMEAQVKADANKIVNYADLLNKEVAKEK